MRKFVNIIIGSTQAGQPNLLGEISKVAVSKHGSVAQEFVHDLRICV